MKIGWKVMGCSFNMELSISVFRYHSHCHMTTVSGISFKRGIKVGKYFTKKSTSQKLNMSPFRLFGWHCNSGWHLLCLGLSTQFVRFRKVRAKVWGVKPGLVTSVFYVSMAYCAYSIYFFHPYCSLPMLEPALLLLAAIFFNVFDVQCQSKVLCLPRVSAWFQADPAYFIEHFMVGVQSLAQGHFNGGHFKCCSGVQTGNLPIKRRLP